MENEKNKINRRNFLQNATTAGLASVLASKALAKSADKKTPATDKEKETAKSSKMPKRVLGKTKIKLPILSFGGMFDITNNQVTLQKAVEWGLTCWDTAYNYFRGNSEIGMGMYLKKHPKFRKKLFLISKASGTYDPKKMGKLLNESLKRLQTDYVDLYFLHYMSDPKYLTEDVRKWAEEKKKQGKIRFFGFSTHSNMPKCLTAGSKLKWIDVIMTRYNFRHLADKKMQAAIDACYKAKIGLIAIKTQGGGPIKADSKEDQKLASHFIKKGYTPQQAKLKILWQDKRFATISSLMPSIAILGANVAAALDQTKLTDADIDVFDQYAKATCDGYCAGCAEICLRALPDMPYIGEVMRYMMYYNNYGDEVGAKELLAKLPASVRAKLSKLNYTKAQAVCPQNLPIAKIMKQANDILT